MDFSKSLQIWEMILSHHMIMVSCAVLWDSRRCLVQCDNGLCNKGSFVNRERWVRSPLCSPQEMKHHWSPMSCSFSESVSPVLFGLVGWLRNIISNQTNSDVCFSPWDLRLKRTRISLGATFISSRCICDSLLLLGKIGVFLRESNHRGLSFLTCNLL